jgi:hypothetical protein
MLPTDRSSSRQVLSAWRLVLRYRALCGSQAVDLLKETFRD